jgi:hypothetical protein
LAVLFVGLQQLRVELLMVQIRFFSNDYFSKGGLLFFTLSRLSFRLFVWLVAGADLLREKYYGLVCFERKNITSW